MDIYNFTTTSEDVDKTYAFKLYSYYSSNKAYLYYKVIKGTEDTTTSINIVKDQNDNTKVTITPTVTSGETIITTADSVEIYINGEKYGSNIAADGNVIYTNSEVNTYSVYAHFIGDDDYSESNSSVSLFTLGSDKFPVNLTINLNTSGIADGDSLKITPIIKNANGEDITGTVDIYEVGIENPVLSGVSNGVGAIYTPNSLNHIAGSSYQLYAVFNGDETYVSINSSKVSYKIKSSFNIVLTVDGETNFDAIAGSYSSSATHYIFYANCSGLNPILNVYDVYNGETNLVYEGNVHGDSQEIDMWFSTSEIGSHTVYVEFVGDDDYLYSKSNNVTFTVYQSRSSYNGKINFNQSSAVEGDKVLITPTILDYSTYANVDVGTFIIYADSSRTEEIATINVGESYEYTIPDVSTSSSSTSLTLYGKYIGAKSGNYIYTDNTFSESITVMKKNNLQLTANGKIGAIEVNKGENITLHVDIDYWTSRSGYDSSYNTVYYSDISIYVDGVENASFDVVRESSGYSYVYNIQDYDMEITQEHTIYAYYSGYNSYSSYYAPAKSNILTVKVVENKDTSISLTPATITAKEGESNTISASVIADSESVTEGNITYYLNGTAIDGFINVSISTVFNTNNLAVGVYNITAKYNGADGYNPSGFSNDVIVTIEEDIITTQGTFTDLASLIASAGDTLVLPYNFAYNSSCDSEFVGGILVNKSITIDGNGSLISGSNLARIFKVNMASIILKNITLVNAKHDNGGAIFVSNSITTLNLVDSIIKDSISNQGAAIHITSGSLNINGTTFINNSANCGGAIYINGGSTTVNINDSTFDDNKATSTNTAGGGAAITVNDGNLVVNNSRFVNNVAVSTGGAINMVNSGDTLTIKGSKFKNNSASDGAGIYVKSKAVVNIVGSNLSDNVASNQGGALYIQYNGANVLVDNVLFVNNSANDGGALVNKLATLTVNKTSFENNGATTNGGAIYASGKVTVINSSLINNVAVSGYNIYQTSEGVVSLVNTTLSIVDPTVNVNESYDLGESVVVSGTFDCGIYNQAFTMKYALDTDENSTVIAKNKVAFSIDLGSELSAGEHTFIIKSFADESGNNYILNTIEKTFNINLPELTTNITLELSSDELLEGKNITITPKVTDSNGNEVSVGNVTIYTDYSMNNPIGTIKLGESINYTNDNINVYENCFFYAKYNGASSDNIKYNPSQTAAGTRYYPVYNNYLNLTANGVKEITIYQGQSVNITANTKGNGVINLTVNDEFNQTLTKGENKTFTLAEIKDYEFTATYTRGSDYYASCVSDKVIVHVVKAPDINVKVDLDSTSLSKNTNITVSVNVSDSGVELDSGIVEIFNESNVKIGQVNLSESKTFKFNVGDVAGSYKLYAKYGDVQSDNKTYIVKDTLTITLERSGSGLVKVGESVTFTISYSDAITENIALYINNVKINDEDGTSTTSVTFNATNVGLNNVSIKFSGNDYFESAVSNNVTVNVVKPLATNVTIILSTSEVLSGKNFTITPKVLDENGDEVTVGDVRIYNTMYYSSQDPVITIGAGKSGNYSDTKSNVGTTNYLYALYRGYDADNAIYAQSEISKGVTYTVLSSNALTLTVNGKNEETINAGESVNVVASLTGGNGVITLYVDGKVNETLTNGEAKSITLSEVKDYEFVANYTRGTDSYISCVSDKVTVHVAEAPDINVKVDLDSTSLSKNTNLTVTVNVTNKGSVVDTGIVEIFNESNVKIGQVNLSESKTFKFNVGDVAGSYKIYAKYGDVQSDNKTYIVKDTLTITLERSGSGLVKVDESVTFTVTYSKEITENIGLYVNGVKIGDESGADTTSVTFDAGYIGLNNVSIKFSGNNYFESAVSNNVSIRVVKPLATNVTIILSTSEVLSGKNFTITPKVLDENGDEVTIGVVKIYNNMYYSSQDPVITIDAGKSGNYSDTTHNVGYTEFLYALYNGSSEGDVIYAQSDLSKSVNYTVYSSNTLTLTVNGKSEDNIYAGGSVDILATLTGGNGVITLYINGIANETLTNGVAKSLTLNEVKDYELVANYTRGDDYYVSCVSNKAIVHVAEAPDVVVKINLDEDSLSKNTNLTVGVNVTNKGSEVESGIVEIFNESNVKIGQVNLSESKTFKFNVGDVAGSYKLYAKYGDVQSDNKTYIVKDTLTITLERSSTGLVKVGDRVTFNITYSGDVSENIGLYVNGVKIGNESGADTTSVTFDAGDIGLNNVSIKFSGNDYFESADSNNVTINVIKPLSTNVTITLSTTEVVSGKNFTITSKVVDENGDEVTIGIVKVYDTQYYSTHDPIATLNAGGSVNYTDLIHNMGVTQFLYAIYMGDSGDEVIYNQSALSSSVNYTIVGETHLILTANGVNETSVFEGTAVDILASLNDGNGVITLFVNGVVNTTLTKDTPISFTLPAGQYTFTANYTRGSDYYLSSTSNTVKVTVIESSATNVIVVSVDDVTLPGDALIKVTATIDGNYTVDVNGTIINVTVSGNSGNKSITLPVGSYYANVSYSGKSSITNATFKVSNPVVEPIKVVLNSTTLNVVNGTTPTLTITLPSNAGGNITVTINGNNYTSTLTNGAAVVSIAGLSAGEYSALVTYSGDVNYASANATVTLKVISEVTPTPVVTKIVTKIVAKKHTFKVKKTKKYSITLKTAAGKVISKVKVYLKVKGKTYSAKTNKKGKATFNLKKLTKKGKYTAKITYKGNAKYYAASKSVKITVKK